MNIEELKGKSEEDLLKIIEDLNTENEANKKAVADKEADILKQNQVVQELKDEVNSKKDLEAPITVTYKKKKYQFNVAKFIFPGTKAGSEPREIIVEDTEWSKEDDLVKFLVESKSQVLKPV